VTFSKLTKSYLKDFQSRVQTSKSAGAKSLEMATRPEVDAFVKGLIELCKIKDTQVNVHHDVQYTKGSRPDWRIEDVATFGIFFFGDHKDTNFNNPFSLSANEKTQIQRYLDFGRPVFVFDGLEFVVFESSLDAPERYALIQKPVLENEDWSSRDINDSIVQKLRNLLNNPGFRRWTETELIEQLALRAKHASEDIVLLLSAPKGSGLNSSEEELMGALEKLRETIVAHHDPSLRNEKACSDFIAQVLTFGLFYAHTRHQIDSQEPEARLKKIKDFWEAGNLGEHAKPLRPFSTIITLLSSTLLDDNALSQFYDEVAAVLSHAEYMGTKNGPQDFHVLFEKFLEKFDRETKFDRGAFYTPPNLAKWMVRASDEIANQEFGSGILESAEKIIDPCCGTGSFLEAAYLELNDKKQKFPALVGFEILPAPYALAHYRLSQIIDNTDMENLSIILTDTLSDQLLTTVKSSSNGFSDELVDANQLSTPPLRFIFGNPPSAKIPKIIAPRNAVKTQVDDFRPPKKDRTGRQNNQKALNNEAYLFLRWCCERLILSSGGMLSIVLPGTFVDSTSFVYARLWLLEKFSAIYVLEVDHDLRVGQQSDSLFAVQQGRVVLIATLKTQIKDKKSVSKVYHCDLRNYKIADKNLFLTSKPNLNDFEELEVTKPNFKFIPTGDFDGELWKKCIPLLSLNGSDGIFKAKCSGIKLSPSCMLFHTQRPILIRRSVEIGSTQNSVPKIIEKWFSGQQKPPNSNKFSDDVRREVSASGKKGDNIKRYQFRPFLSGWFLDSEKIYSALKPVGGGTRSRPEVRSAIGASATGIAIAPAPKDISPTLTRFACFVWNVPDNDLAARGNGMIYLDLFPQGKGEKPSSNIEENILSQFKFSSSPSKALLYYTYGILSSKAYLDTFDVALFTKSDAKNPPRVPFVSDEKTLKEITRLGKIIAECENFDLPHKQLDSISFHWPEELDGIELSGYEYDNENEVLILKSQSSEKIEISGVSADTIDLHMMGHGVIEKWIRERKFAYLRRTFQKDDLLSLCETISRVQTQIKLIGELDPFVEKVLSSEQLNQF